MFVKLLWQGRRDWIGIQDSPLLEYCSMLNSSELLQIWKWVEVSLVFPQTHPGKDLTGDLMEVGGRGRRGGEGEGSDNFVWFQPTLDNPHLAVRNSYKDLPFSQWIDIRSSEMPKLARPWFANRLVIRCLTLSGLSWSWWSLPYLVSPLSTLPPLCDKQGNDVPELRKI